jgi:DNA processing protein
MNDRFRPVRLSDEQRIDWLRLIRTERVGPRTFRTLINQFGGAARAIARLPDLAHRGGGKLKVPSREEAADEIAAAAKLGVTFIGGGAIRLADYRAARARGQPRGVRGPGSPLDARASGTNRLLKDGATLVTSAADVVEVLTPILGRSIPPAILEPREDDKTELPLADDKLRTRIIGLLGTAPVSIDDLVREAGAPPGAVLIVLLELELAGKIERHGGGLVSLA